MNSISTTNRIIALLLLLLLNSCNSYRKSALDNNNHIAIKALTYGLTRGQIAKKEKINQENTFDGTLLQKTNNIPAVLGNQFGILFEVKSNQLVALPIEIVWILPKVIVNHRGEQTNRMSSTAMCTTNSPLWANYGLDLENEVIKGKWTCQIYYKGKKLYQKHFILY